MAKTFGSSREREDRRVKSSGASRLWRAGWLGEQRAASFFFGMFERFTEPARHVLKLAQDEARSLRHDYVGSEHVLLALLRAEEGVAANVLNDLGITPEQVRDAVPIGGASPEVMEGQLRLTPRAKMALELSIPQVNFHAGSVSVKRSGTETTLAELRERVAALGAGWPEARRIERAVHWYLAALHSRDPWNRFPMGFSRAGDPDPQVSAEALQPSARELQL